MSKETMTSAVDAFIGKLTSTPVDKTSTAQPPSPSNEPPPAPEPPKTDPKPEPTPDKPVDKVVEQSPEPAKESDDKWPRTAQEWKKFRAARDQQIKERDEKLAKAEARLKELEAKAATATAVDVAEYEKTKKERDELDEQLRMANVEKHPKFKAYFDGKTKAQIELAKRIVGAEKFDEVTEVLNMAESDYRNERIENLMADLSPIQQSRFGAVVNALTEIELEKQTEIAKAREYSERISKDQMSKAEQMRKAYEKGFEDTIARIQDPTSGDPAFQLKDGNEEWNKGVKERIEIARNICFGDNKPETVLQAILDGVKAKAVLEDAKSVYEENQKLKAQVAELSKSTPGLRNGDAEKPTEEPRRVKLKAGSYPSDITSQWISQLPK